MSNSLVTAPRSGWFGPRQVLAILGTLVLILVSLLVAGVRPAEAAPGDCPSGKACLWRDLNCQTASSGANYYGFNQYDYNLSQRNYLNTTSNVNDTATGVRNSGNFESVRYYKDIFKGGSYITYATGTSDCDLGDGVGVTGDWNNSISSGYFSTYW